MLAGSIIKSVGFILDNLWEIISCSLGVGLTILAAVKLKRK